jgi:hypothetical protein
VSDKPAFEDEFKVWDRWLNERGLTRGEAGERILHAYSVGMSRGAIVSAMRCSPNLVSTLAQAARRHRERQT